jgi:hypothetical protein
VQKKNHPAGWFESKSMEVKLKNEQQVHRIPPTPPSIFGLLALSAICFNLVHLAQIAPFSRMILIY